ncbi:hypothetical protein [Edaphobacter bradus]|uniref:hypothetical protein n=1 Tax=Edaphobacter bradus TaxID=2259016 RepID=UPI0021E0D4B7|nr:hypothetical protein [Edaphobacter bradus]
MTQASQNGGQVASQKTGQATGQGRLLGVPLGDLGWFATLLMGAATGFMAFFAATFVGIISILFYNSSGHHAVDYAVSYRDVGLPVGIVVLAAAWGYLGTLRVRRMLRRG